MTDLFLLLILLFNAAILPISLKRCRDTHTILRGPFFLCEFFGSFVWADQVVFSVFWVVAASISLFLHNFLLFLFIYCLFWTVRSSGEVMYWFLQQFHPRPGNEPHLFWVNKHVPGEAVWFVHQIFWQCIVVVSLLLTFYTGYLLLQTLT